MSALLTLDEVAERLRISYRQAQRLLWDGKLAYHKPTGRTGAPRVSEEDLADYLNSVHVTAKL